MDFQKTLGGARRERRRGSLLADPARLELLNLPAVSELLSASMLKVGDTPDELRAVLELEQAVLLRELARRTGDVQWTAKAAATADRAARDAGAETRLFAAARLQRALCALQTAELFGDGDGEAEAARWLDEAERALGCAPGRLNGPGLIRARLTARAALRIGDRDGGLTAVTRFDEAISALDARVRATGSGEPDWAAAQCERGELMIGLGAKRKEMGLIDQAVRDLGRLAALLDASRLPLSWMRAETLHGTALRALGELTGEPRLLKDAAHAFAGAWDAVPSGHSPMDRAAAAHGLGLTLHALAEASGEPRAFASGVAAFDRALTEMTSGAPTHRSIVAYDRAACLARGAERSGDPNALAEAEAAFRIELTHRNARKDPLAWAVTQVALARVYEARADLLGDAGELADATFALTEALEVFADHGQRSLSDIALSALERLRVRRRPS